MKKTSVYIITITAALSLLLCACGARTGNAVDDVKDDVEDAGKQVVDGAGDIVDDVVDTTHDAADDMTGSDGVVKDDDGIIDDDDTGRVDYNGSTAPNDVGYGTVNDVPGATETDGSINAGNNSLDTATDSSIGAVTTTEAPTAR